MTTATMPERATGRKLGDVKAVAEKCDCSPRHVYRLCDAGRMPAPRKLGSLVRWDLEEIDRWIADGCRPVRQVKGGA
jgi:excisionase family DNA binding protein